MKEKRGKASASVSGKIKNSTFAKTKIAKEHGITLIVTIIVLLILAGVTINLEVNQSGIFERAQNATRAYNQAEKTESQAMQNAVDEMDKYAKQYGLDSGSSSTSGGSSKGSGSSDSGSTTEGGSETTGTTVTAGDDSGKTFTIGGTETAPTITTKESSSDTPTTTTIAVNEGGNLKDPSTYTDETKAALSKVYGTKVNYTGNDTINARTWRIFFIDFGGKYGTKGTIYLKADWTANDTELSSYSSYTPSDTTILAKMNPLWYAQRSGATWNVNKHCVAWLCDTIKWTDYATSNANYAIGGPSAEMYCDSYNSVKHTTNAHVLTCNYQTEDAPGYGYLVDGTAQNSGWYTNSDTVDYVGYSSMYCGSNGSLGSYWWWQASPSSDGFDSMWIVGDEDATLRSNVRSMVNGLCPLVSLKSGI